MGGGGGRGAGALVLQATVSESREQGPLPFSSHRALTHPPIPSPPTHPTPPDEPLVWYGKPHIAYGIYLPAAFAALLLPAALASPVANPSARSAGAALLFAAAASLLTECGMQSAFLFAAWAGATVLAAAAGATGPLPRSVAGAARLLLPFAPAVAVCLPTTLSVTAHVMEKIGLAGSAPGVVGAVAGDAAVGVVAGLSAFLTLGTLVPYVVSRREAAGGWWRWAWVGRGFQRWGRAGVECSQERVSRPARQVPTRSYHPTHPPDPPTHAPDPPALGRWRPWAPAALACLPCCCWPRLLAWACGRQPPSKCTRGTTPSACCCSTCMSTTQARMGASDGREGGVGEGGGRARACACARPPPPVHRPQPPPPPLDAPTPPHRGRRLLLPLVRGGAGFVAAGPRAAARAAGACRGALRGQGLGGEHLLACLPACLPRFSLNCPPPSPHPTHPRPPSLRPSTPSTTWFQACLAWLPPPNPLPASRPRSPC